jgi:uncharacterized membrane protein YhaH (DUF805 family)
MRLKAIGAKKEKPPLQVIVFLNVFIQFFSVQVERFHDFDRFQIAVILFAAEFVVLNVVRPVQRFFPYL